MLSSSESLLSFPAAESISVRTLLVVLHKACSLKGLLLVQHLIKHPRVANLGPDPLVPFLSFAVNSFGVYAGLTFEVLGYPTGAILG